MNIEMQWFHEQVQLSVDIVNNNVIEVEAMPRKRPSEEDRKPVGRPKVLPDDLDTRIQIRCKKAEEEAWDAKAEALGYSRSQWIRKVLNAALKPKAA